MRKQCFALISLIVLSLTVISCGGATEATPDTAVTDAANAAAVTTEAETAESAEEEAPAEASGEIVFLNNGTLEFDPATAYNLERFKEAHPEITVTVVEENDVLARLSTMVTGGGEAFDVAEPADVDVPQFIQIGALMPMDDLFPPDEMARYPEGTLGAITGPDGHIYGKPHFVLPQVFLYNTELLAAEGFDSPPKTWDEIIEYGQKLTNENQWGYMYGLAPNRDTYYIFASYLYHAGGQLFNDDFTAAFNSEEGREALQFIVDLRNKYEIVPPGVNTYDGDDVMNPFIL
ncbi:MAG: extracellular solute-binding protein, partial [Anaerolineae bacterium]|nr:extracellular solute-binding protein [Anaerolineae bacterium]